MYLIIRGFVLLVTLLVLFLMTRSYFKDNKLMIAGIYLVVIFFAESIK